MLCREFFQNGAFLQITPSLWVLAWGKGVWQKKPSLESMSFYAPDFFLETHTPWWVPSFSQLTSSPSFFNTERKEKFLRVFQDSCRREFNKELQFIKAHFQKAVPVFFSNSETKPSYKERLSWIERVFCESDEELFSYGLWDETEGFIGRSPEMLFSKQKSYLKTMALAGTSKITDIDKLLKDKKEIREHEFVVSDLKRKLTPLGKVHISKRTLKKLSSLAHLKTDMEVELKNDVSIEGLVKHLHPTAALGGVPLIKVWTYLKQQNQERKRWGAPFGVYLPRKDQFFSIIAIRNIRWDSNITQIGAGCGIISESIEKKEWEEVQLKKESVKSFFRITK